jgi:uncharacterized DUF497 family protein
MEFEFDKQKSRTNKEKHGIDFTEARRIWDDPDRIEIPARTEDPGHRKDRCEMLVSRYHLSREENKNYLRAAVQRRGDRDL